MIGPRLLQRAGLRAQRRQPLRLALVLLSTALGVAAMIGTFAVNDQVLGAFETVRRAGRGAAPLKVVGPGGVSNAILPVLRGVDGVRHAVPILTVHAPLAEHEGALLVIGVDPRDRDAWMNAATTPPRLDIDLSVLVLPAPWLVLDRRGAERTGVGKGDLVELMTPHGRTRFRVAGLFDAGAFGAAIGGYLAITAMPIAERLAGVRGVFDRVDLFLDPGRTAASVLPAVSDRLPSDLRVEPSETMTSGADSGFAAMRPGLLLAGLTAVLAGAFLVHNVHALSLAERRTWIGTARALGAGRRQVLAPLLFEGLVLGILGSLLGVPLGWAVARVAVTGTRDDLPLVGVPGRPEVHLPGWDAVTLSVATGVVATMLAVLLLAVPAAAEAPALSVRRRLEPRPRALGWVAVTFALTFVAACFLAGPLARLSHDAGYAVIGVLGLLFGILGPVLARTALAPLERLFRRRVILRLAIQNLLRHPRRVGLTVAALGLAVALAVQSATVVGSFHARLTRWIEDGFAADLWLVSGSSRIGVGRSQPLDDGFLDRVAEVPGVASVRGVRGVFIPVGERWVYLIGLDARSWLADSKLEWHGGDAERAADALSAGTGAVISDNYAMLTGTRVGDTLSIPAPTGPYEVEVAGIVTDYSWGQGTIAIDRSVLRTRHLIRTVDLIGVVLKPSADVGAVRQGMLGRFGASHGLHVLDSAAFEDTVSDELDGLFGFASSQQYVVLLIAFLAVLNTVGLSILARHKETELLGAVGASPRQLRRLAMVEGAALAGLGAFFGLAVGAVISRVLLHDILPWTAGWRFGVVLPFGTMAALLAAALAVGAAAGWIVSVRGPR
ncbi:MAG: hypothetical protein CL910_09945 [Deltaproteobacteria bacterium]|nr:hypothetical protein [Deltaproteobacteria bacterium]